MTGNGEAFFDNDEYFTGPPLSEDLIRGAEARLGYRLPAAYLRLLAERNGGVPKRRCFRTPVLLGPRSHRDLGASGHRWRVGDRLG